MPIQNYDRPIFIVGQSNAGTKCLFYTLFEHSELGGFRIELHNFGVCPLIPKIPDRIFSLYPIFRKYRDNEVGHQEQDIRQKLIEHSQRSNKFVDGKRLIFKDPRLSIKTPMIKRLWPDAYIVNIIRNPYAVAEGIRRRHHGEVDIPTAIAQWRVNYSIIEIDKQVKTVRYEDMIEADRYPGSKFWEELLEFLELDKDGLEIPNQCDYSQFDKTTNAGSISNLSNWEKRLITKVAFPWAKKYGYEPIKLDG